MFARRKRKKKIRRVIFYLLFFALLIAGAVFYSNNCVTVSEYELSFSSLPASFDGYRIAQLSDIHGGGSFGERDERLLKPLADAKVNIIVLTGDLVDDDHPPESVRTLLLRLSEIAPVYYVTGNHEWAAGYVPELERLFAEVGVTALRNEYELLTIGSESIALAGVDDPNGWADRKTPGELKNEISGQYGDIFTVLLAHRPDDINEYRAMGYSLVLSGHVHGGVVRLPWLGGLVSPSRDFFPEYSKGVYEAEDGSAPLVMSAGLAKAAGFPRLFNPLDVPIITLRAG